MTVFLLDYLVVSTCLLLIACCFRLCFREPSRRLVLTRLVLVLLVVSAVVLLVPNRPCVSLVGGSRDEGTEIGRAHV
jgi:hypothetical protein